MISDRKAIDIVLLPPPAIADSAVKINKMLNDYFKNKTIVLDKKTCLPHISLAMGSITSENLEILLDDLLLISDKYLPYEASFKGYAAVKTSENKVVSGIDIIKNEVISNLQDEINTSFSKFNNGVVTPDMIYPDETEITDFTLEYSANYLKNSAGDNFSPHITLGNGNVYELKNIPVIPSKFICENIAVCHLGNNCTCRDILWKYFE